MVHQAVCVQQQQKLGILAANRFSLPLFFFVSFLCAALSLRLPASRIFCTWMWSMQRNFNFLNQFFPLLFMTHGTLSPLRLLLKYFGGKFCQRSVEPCLPDTPLAALSRHQTSEGVQWEAKNKHNLVGVLHPQLPVVSGEWGQ